jgi:hypothetical protein
MNSKHLFLVVLELAISFSTTKVAAQSLTTGSISGAVTDPSNALIHNRIRVMFIVGFRTLYLTRMAMMEISHSPAIST